MKENGIVPKIPFIQKDDDAAFLWAYFMATQGEDLRKGDLVGKRALELRDLACRWALTEYGRKFEWCLMKYGYLSWPLHRIAEEFQIRAKSRMSWGFSSGVVCCESCHVGTSTTTFEEIEEQRKKFDGLYICRGCEKAAHQISAAPFGKIETGSGQAALIAKDGVYHDEGMRAPGSSMLGFGGRWYLLFISQEVVPAGCEIKLVNPETGERKPYTVRQTRIAVTNNLFVDRSLHEKLQPIFANKVNTRIVPIELHQLKELRNILNSRDWFQEKLEKNEPT